jgi:hypothetical protein
MYCRIIQKNKLQTNAHEICEEMWRLSGKIVPLEIFGFRDT